MTDLANAISDIDLAYSLPGGLGVLASRGAWNYTPHIEYLEDALLGVASGRITRLIVCMPPQHGKSQLVSKYFTAWTLGRFPDKRIILASYESTFASGWGEQSRNILKEFGPTVFGVTVNDSSQAKDNWGIAGHVGGMMSVGAGGPITGRSADIFIIDDPTKNHEEALSPRTQESLWDWYVSTAYTRLQKKAAIIIIMTRWAYNDLVGKLLKQEAEGIGDKWHKVILPAIATENDVLGRDPGAPLWPEERPLEFLKMRQEVMGSFWFDTMYQQSPRPRGGDQIKVEWFRRYRHRPLRSVASKIVLSIDTAQKAQEINDYTVIQVWFVFDGGYYLIDVVRERMEHPRLIAVTKNMCAAWRPHTVLIEDKGSGISLIQHLRKETSHGVVAIEPCTDKGIRMQNETAVIEAGNVYLPEAGSQPWLYEFEEEIFGFPNTVHKDQVDAFSQFLFYMREKAENIVDLW